MFSTTVFSRRVWIKISHNVSHHVILCILSRFIAAWLKRGRFMLYFFFHQYLFHIWTHFDEMFIDDVTRSILSGFELFFTVSKKKGFHVKFYFSSMYPQLMEIISLIFICLLVNQSQPLAKFQFLYAFILAWCFQSLRPSVHPYVCSFLSCDRISSDGVFLMCSMWLPW